MERAGKLMKEGKSKHQSDLKMSGSVVSVRNVDGSDEPIVTQAPQNRNKMKIVNY